MVKSVDQAICLIPVRGFAGKSRLRRSHGGLLSNRQAKTLISALVTDTYNEAMSVQELNGVRLACPKWSKSMLEFCHKENINLLELHSRGINPQFAEMQKWANEHFNSLLIVASDLPCKKDSFIRRILRRAKALSKRYKKFAIICPSKHLGSATIFIQPPTAFRIILNTSQFNLPVQVRNALNEGVNVSLLSDPVGYFDIDDPDDLLEAIYLSRFRSHKFGQKVYNCLKTFDLL